MSSKVTVTFILMGIFFQSLFSQNSTLKGTIIDGELGEPLLGATISTGKVGTITDFDGTFELELQAGKHTVDFSYVGYQSFERTFTLAEDETVTVEIELLPSATLLETATVTSGKFEKPLGEVTVSLEVLKPNLIENTNKVTLDAALEKVPGVTIIDGQANIRGGSGFSQGAGSRVLLLVDDIPILSADAAFPNWDDIPIENLSQVEVLKGASSALFGSAALNGIINVRTAYPKAEPVTKFSAALTTYFKPEDASQAWWDDTFTPYTSAYSLSHRQKFGKFDVVLGGYYLQEDTYNKEYRKRYGRFNTNLRYRIHDRLSVGLNLNFNNGVSESFFYWGDFERPYQASGNELSRNNRNRYNIDPFVTYFDKAGNRHQFKSRIYHSENDNISNRSNITDTYYGEYQFQRKFNFREAELVTTAGFVGMHNEITAELYGDTTFTSRNLAGYAQADLKLYGVINFSAGFRYENNFLDNPGFSIRDDRDRIIEQVLPSQDSESKPVFRFGVNVKASDYTFIRASWGQGYRFPSIAEKFIFTDVGGFFVAPNPFLDSERGWSTELGIKQGFKLAAMEGFIDIAAFIMSYQDMIEFNFVTDTLLTGGKASRFKAINIGDTEIRGMEISVAGTGEILGLRTSLLAGYTYVDPRFLDFDTTEATPGNETVGQINALNSSSEENVLKYRSRHSFKLDFQLDYKKLSVGIASFYNSRMEAFDRAFLLIIPGLLQNADEITNEYMLYNARMAYQFTDNIKLSVLFNNITNAQYSIRPGFFGATRNVGARLDFKF